MTPGGASTSSIASAYLVERIEAAGGSAADLLEAAGVGRDQLAAPDTVVPLPIFAELWRRAAASEPDIGLTLVERFPAGQMHLLAHLALRSATVGAALADASRFAAVTSAADAMHLQRDGAVARFGYTCLEPTVELPWLAEHYFAMLVVFVGRAAGRALPLRAVRLRGPRLAPASAYQRRFGRAPEFAAAGNELEFDAEALDWPLLTHDAYLHALLAGVVRARHAASPVDADAPDLVDDVRREIGRLLVLGEVASLAAVATALALRPRTLRARIAGQDTGFRALHDEVRRDLVREHLARGASVTDVACLLGFSEPAALQHACLRWFGQPAGEVRRRLLAGLAPVDAHQPARV